MAMMLGVRDHNVVSFYIPGRVPIWGKVSVAGAFFLSGWLRTAPKVVGNLWTFWDLVLETSATTARFLHRERLDLRAISGSCDSQPFCGQHEFPTPSRA